MTIEARENKKPGQMTRLLWPPMANYGMELAMVLKVSPILGPNRLTTLITTSATNAMMIAYSTSPWPLSFGANNMRKFLSLKNMSENLRP